jgi:HlyD family secretion protein
MRRWLIRLAVVAALVVLWIVARQTVLAPDPVPVRVASAERGAVESILTNSKAGTIKARRRAKLSTGTSGIVVDLPVRRGDRVQAGELMLRLEDATQQAQLAQAERSLEVAAATQARACLAAERARREWERNVRLSEEELISVDLLDRLESAWELAVADCRVAEAEVARQQAAVGVARAELDKTLLRAPFDAIVAEVSIELGEWVTPSVPLLAAPQLMDAIDPSSLYIAAPMDEVDAARLDVGQIARVTIDSHPDRVFAGRVAAVAPYVLDVEEQNRTVEIEVELVDEAFSATLLPGTSADVEIVLERHEDVLRVPTFALIEGGRVMVVEEGRLAERAPTIGLRNWEWAEVLEGLDADQEVVVSLDRPEVRVGAQVTVERGP